MGCWSLWDGGRCDVLVVVRWLSFDGYSQCGGGGLFGCGEAYNSHGSDSRCVVVVIVDVVLRIMVMMVIVVVRWWSLWMWYCA